MRPTSQHSQGRAPPRPPGREAARRRRRRAAAAAAAPCGMLAAVLAAAALLVLSAPLLPAAAATGVWSPEARDSVVGRVEIYRARYRDTLLDVARRHGMGIEELKLANPGLDMWIPGEGAAVRIPRRFVLPAAPRKGLVINLPEMRVYYYSGEGEGATVRSWPISIGRVGWDTPLGRTSIVGKKARPTWTPPESIRKEREETGEPPLPPVVPAGPGNPLGSHALYLGFPSYLIHGTNRPYSIGMRVSHGCIRLYPEHIVELFELADAGTPVTIVRQRVKAGFDGDRLYLEVHPDADVAAAEARPDMTEAVRALVAALPEEGPRPVVDWARVQQALATANGVPFAVGERAKEVAAAADDTGR